MLRHERHRRERQSEPSQILLADSRCYVEIFYEARPPVETCGDSPDDHVLDSMALEHFEDCGRLERTDAQETSRAEAKNSAASSSERRRSSGVRLSISSISTSS